MKGALLLAWRYLAYHKVRTGILVLCITLVFLLPIAVQMLVDRQATSMAARARATPLVAGAKGSRYDLVLSTLYFRGRVPRATTMAEAERIAESGLADPIPILARQRARGFPVVGTSNDYFGFRSLRVAEGTPPLMLGDAVLGAAVARKLQVGVGDRILSDRGNVYDQTQGSPLRLHVVGVLAEAGTPDDAAVFVDIKTVWVIEGLSHGHQSDKNPDPRRVLERDGKRVVFNAGLVEYNEITPDNVDSYHVHGDPLQFPLTAILVVPRSSKAATLLKGRFSVSRTAQLLVPLEVVDEIFGFVFRVKVFFDANVALVAIATGLFLLLIVLLTLRVRRGELETLAHLGVARGRVAAMLLIEWGFVVALGVALAALAATVVYWGLRGAWMMPA